MDKGSRVKAESSTSGDQILLQVPGPSFNFPQQALKGKIRKDIKQVLAGPADLKKKNKTKHIWRAQERREV